MKYTLLICIVSLFIVSCAQNGVTDGPSAPPVDILEKIAFPTVPGAYSFGQWQYIYTIENKGSRSEKRIGKLIHNDLPVEGEYGEVKETVFGKFMYFNTGWNQGWLNTQTYNQPVFKAASPQKQ